MAFSGSNSLRSIRLPSTLEEIGAMPFYGCEGLRRMEMPKETYERFSEIFTDLAGVECSVVNRNASQDTVNEKNCQEMHMKQQYRLCP